MITTALTLYFAYLLCLLWTIFAGAYRWRTLLLPARLFYLLVVLALLTEAFALISDLLQHNNHLVYNFSDILQMAIAVLYFASCLERPRSGFAAAAFSTMIGALTCATLPEGQYINTYFLLWTGLVIIALSLYLIIWLHRRDGTAQLTKFAHFWFAATLLFYWAFNLLNQQLFSAIMHTDIQFAYILNTLQQGSNILASLVVGITFFRIPKLVQ